MSPKGNSLKDLKSLREAVLAEEKAKTEALLHNLSQKPAARGTEQPGGNSPPSGPLDLPSTQVAATPAFASPNSARDRRDSSAPDMNHGPEPTPARAAIRPDLAGPALIIPLTPKIQERLQRNVEEARWSPAEVVIELIRNCLHQAYPSIQFEETLVAREGTFRSFERHPLETFLKIVSGQGVFKVTVRREHPDLQNWTAYLRTQNAPDPDRAAVQFCLASLQAYLESVVDYELDGWTKTISPESFLVAPLEVSYTSI
jgi:hypothetical protein